MGSVALEIDPLVQSLHTKLGITMEELDQAVTNALQYGAAEQEEEGITTGQSFLRFADELLRWVPRENFQAKRVYKSLCLFYFILSQPPLGRLQTQPDPSSQHGKTLTPLSQWMVEYAGKTGQWMDSANSLTLDTLQTLRDSPRYRTWEAEEPEGGWRTFNEFFGRRLLPGARPIAFSTGSRNDDSHACHAVDSVFNGSWAITEQNIARVKSLDWSISEFLDNSDYAERFAGGVWTHSLLNTFNYHRIHAPVRGTVVEAKCVSGLCTIDVTVDPSTRSLVPRLRHKPKPNATSDGVKRPVGAPRDPGYVFLQGRGLMTIDHPTLGYGVVVPIGMAQVSSVVLSVSPGQVIEKGQEISYFQFGGSDVVMIFEKKAMMNFEPSIVGSEYLMGQVLGKAEFPVE